MVELPKSPNKLLGFIDLGIYGTFFRLRMLYLAGIALAIVLAIAIGGTIQMLYSIYGNPQSLPVTMVVSTYLIVPGMIWVTSIIATRLGQLIVDVLDVQPLVEMRALLQVATGLKAAKVDGALIVLTEVVPFVGWLVRIVVWQLSSDMDPDPMVMGYFEAGIVWVCFLAVVEAIFQAIVSWNPEKDEEYHHKANQLRAQVFGQSLTVAGEHHHVDLGHMVESLFGRWEPEKEPISIKTGLLLLIAGVLTPMAMGVAAHGHELPFYVTLVSVVVGLLFLSEGTKVLAPRLLGRSYIIIVALFLFLASVLTVLQTDLAAGFMGVDHTSGELWYGAPEPGFSYAPLALSAGYPVCQMRWGAEMQEEALRLSAIDLAVLSTAAYLNDEEVARMATDATRGTALAGMRLEYLEPTSIVGRWAVFTFPDSRVRVLAIRGTTNSEDAMVDMDLFATVQIMQFFDKVAPLLQILPSQTIQNFVNLFVARKLWGQPRIWDSLMAFATKLQETSQADSYELVITGHSLGGSLAAIVGAKLSIPTLAFSPAGQQWSQRRFGVNTFELERYVTVVQPDTDPVPRVDRQPGFRQQIRCLANPLQCHTIQKTLCELYTICGDARGRFVNCSESGMFKGPIAPGLGMLEPGLPEPEADMPNLPGPSGPGPNGPNGPVDVPHMPNLQGQKRGQAAAAPNH